VHITTSTDKKKHAKHAHGKDRVDFDVLAMQLKKFRSVRNRQTSAASTSASFSNAEGGAFSSISISDPSAKAAATTKATFSGGTSLLPSGSQRSRQLNESSRLSETDGGRPLSLSGVASKLQQALPFTILRPHAVTTFNDVGGEMGLFGVVTCAVHEEADGRVAAGSSGPVSDLHEIAPDPPEVLARWKQLSEHVRKLHLLAKHLMDPLDPRVNVHRFIDALAESDAVPTPAFSGKSLQQVQAALDDLAALFSLHEHEEELHTIVDRHSVAEYGRTSLAQFGQGRAAGNGGWTPQLGTVTQAGDGLANETESARDSWRQL